MYMLELISQSENVLYCLVTFMFQNFELHTRSE